MIRICSVCGQSEPVVQFYADGRKVCKECVRKVCRNYYQEHRQQRNAATVAWNADNRDRVNELARERYARKKAGLK
jgi:recombinational DNA repair protein (RecF pathway)